MPRNSIRRKAAVLAAEQHGVTQQQAHGIIQDFLTLIKSEVAANGHVELRGFGTFNKQHRAARKARNPKKPAETIDIPAKDVVVFKVSKSWDV